MFDRKSARLSCFNCRMLQAAIRQGNFSFNRRMFQAAVDRKSARKFGKSDIKLLITVKYYYLLFVDNLTILCYYRNNQKIGRKD